jgi:hypothetical protein
MLRVSMLCFAQTLDRVQPPLRAYHLMNYKANGVMLLHTPDTSPMRRLLSDSRQRRSRSITDRRCVSPVSDERFAAIRSPLPSCAHPLGR